jgi:hypothetical protein
MTIIKTTAHENQNAVKKHLNILLGGNFKDSEFYHSFGPFIQQNFTRFDPDTPISFPLNMKYKNIAEVSVSQREKMPHQRLYFKCKQSFDITLKIFFLHIKFSAAHHNSESKQKITDSMSEILETFMGVKDFEAINQYCNDIKCLTQTQIDLIMNQDTHLYYKLRCRQFKNENPEDSYMKIEM